MRSHPADVRDERHSTAVGRHARLELHFERRGDRTVLAHSYAEPPFRAGRVFDLEGAAYAIIVSSGPGVFAGDTLHQSIHVGPGARVVLTSQAALQVHPAAAPHPAVVRNEYHVDRDAELRCQWDPVIPFADSRIDQHFHLRLTSSSRLYWSDALMAGRVDRGEAWQFASLAHELQVTIDHSVAYLERFRIEPADRLVKRRWVAGDATHLSTMLVRHPNATPGAVDEVQKRVTETGLDGIGVDLLEPGFAVARLMQSSGPAFARARACYRASVVEVIFGGPEAPARK